MMPWGMVGSTSQMLVLQGPEKRLNTCLRKYQIIMWRCTCDLQGSKNPIQHLAELPASCFQCGQPAVPHVLRLRHSGDEPVWDPGQQAESAGPTCQLFVLWRLHADALPFVYQWLLGPNPPGIYDQFILSFLLSTWHSCIHWSIRSFIR